MSTNDTSTSKTVAEIYATKPPSITNTEMAKWITQESGVEVSAKQVQVVMSLASAFRRSDAGKAEAAARAKATKAKKSAALKAKRASLEAQLAKLKAAESR